MVPRILSVFAMAPFVSLAAGYSWSFANAPVQCGELTINITGSGGQEPYTLLIVPVGNSTLLGGVEVRKPMEIPFNTSTSVTFTMNYPENSQFAAVVSDSTTFGNGGTSGAVTVAASDSSSCFDATKVETQPWVFNFGTSTNPYSAPIVECSPLRIWWDNDQNIRGTAQFQGVIPGGQSFEIPADSITNQAGQGTGFQWTPPLENGTTVIVIGGDENGQGTGGFQQFTVQPGNTTCLDSTSPSSTLGIPAGGSIPTGTTASTGTSTASASGSHADVPPIVGGVVGGVAGLVAIGLALLFAIRRHRYMAEKNIDLFNDGGEKGPAVADIQRLPDNYQVVPFAHPDSNVTPTYDPSAAGIFPGSPGADHQSYFSATTSDSGYRGGLASPPVTPPSVSAKSPAQLVLRPINIIQHDDAGRTEETHSVAHAEPQSVELPPAYGNIKHEADVPTGEGSGAGSTNVGLNPATAIDEKTRVG